MSNTSKVSVALEWMKTAGACTFVIFLILHLVPKKPDAIPPLCELSDNQMAVIRINEGVVSCDVRKAYKPKSYKAGTKI